MSNRVTFLIDGFNLYHSLRKASESGRDVNWLNVWGSCRALMPDIDPNGLIHELYYFTANIKTMRRYNSKRAMAQKVYLQAIKHYGAQIVQGTFKQKRIECKLCAHQFYTHEEKKTDVAIALKAVELAAKCLADTIVIVTGDTDQVPTFEYIKRDYPSMVRGVVFPWNKRNNELEIPTDWHIVLSKLNYMSNQMPSTVTLIGGKVLTKPPEW